jgi:large subunit ribosomal protein L10
MTREEKQQVLSELTAQIAGINSFYITDASTLNVASINKFRRLCFERGVTFKVVKNTLLKKALESCEGNYEGLYEVLSGPTSIMFAEGASLPAKVLKEFRESSDKPVLKAAFIDSDVYLGDDKLKELASLKSKEDLLADVIFMLQSPAMNVISGLQSGGSNLSGILKTLSERN